MQAQMDVSDVKAKVQEIQGAFGKLKLPNSIGGKLNIQFEDVYRSIKKYQDQLEKPIKTKSDLSGLTKTTNEVDTNFKNLLKTINELDNEDIKLNIDSTELSKATEQLNILQQQFSEAMDKEFNGTNALDQFLDRIKNSKSALKGTAEDIKEFLQAGNFKEARDSAKELFSHMNKLKQISGFKGVTDAETDLENFNEEITNLIDNLEGKFKPSIQVIDELKNKITGLSAEHLEIIAQTIKKAGIDAEASRNQFNAGADGVRTMGEAAVRSTQEVEQLTKRVQYFFGLQNQIQLFKRVVRDAFNTVQELDKTMTETAVVTDFSVGDMWKQLPEYTAEAKALGATINDLYQANTLYYQQGLNSTQAMQLGVETLKMARIAGMEAKDATDAMTAALRGFNMELNDVSAQRINDVYSRLAAITASDTQEISTAVEKTASLAYSAGMDVEQTAAFLSQIIETTREAPETAGTALKTIIARFGEVKKLSDEGLTVGTDAEGEEIDINKVDKALKTAGISLQDFIQGNESLGDVFVKLSERWSTLSLEQQRYIATMAAGARQQSRFIAMMQNTERTQYLMSEAYGAAGASDIQFGKTLEGLEAKLNQLKDEWQQFIMSMANQQIIKVAVDLLTSLLKVVNKIIDTAGKIGGVFGDTGEGITKAAVAISGFILAFKKASQAIDKGIGVFGKILSKSNTPWKASFGEKLLKNVTSKRDKQSIFGRIFMPDSTSAVEEGIKEGTEKGKAKADAEVKTYNAIKAVANQVDDGQEVADGIKEGTEKGIAKAKAEKTAEIEAEKVFENLGLALAGIEGAEEGGVSGEAFVAAETPIKTSGQAAWAALSAKMHAIWGAIAGSSFAKAFSAAVAFAIPIAIGAATVGGIAFAAKKMADRYESNAKELAENIKNTYTEELEKGTSGLAKIKENEVRFKELAKGVDEYGRNINLTNEEYQEYVTISNEIAEVTPDLIVGYTEEGKALIGKAEALDKATKAQEKNIQATKEAYASVETLNTLLSGARASNFSDAAYRAAVDTGQFGTEAGPGGLIFGDTAGYRTRLGKAGHDLATLTNKELDFLGRKIDLENLSLDDAKFIQQHTDQLINILKAQYPKLEEEIDEMVQSLSTEAGATLETVNPIVDSLNNYLSFEKLDPESLKLPANMISDVQKELSEMVYRTINSGDNINGEALQKQVRNYMTELRTLTGPFSEYTKIQEQASVLQQQYTEDLALGKDATTIYNESAELLVNRLDSLADQYKNTTGAGAIFYKQLQENRSAILSFVETIEVDLQSAFNTMEDNFASTKTAIEEYDKEVTRDYSDNADAFSKIIEDMQADGASAGKGTRKYRAGARALLSEKYWDKPTDEINKKLESISDWFQEGEEGAKSWYRALFEDAALGEKSKYSKWTSVDENDNLTITAKTDEELEAFAKALGISTDALQSLIEKTEQFLPTQFMDTKQALAALFSGNGGVRGGIQQYDDMGSRQVVYTSKAGLKRSQIAAGIYDYETRHANAEELRSKGVITFDSKYIEKEFHNNIMEVMKAFQVDDTQTLANQYTELTAKFLQANADADEIVEYYKQMGQIGEGGAYANEEKLRSAISDLQIQGIDELVDPQQRIADNSDTAITLLDAISKGEQVTESAVQKAIEEAKGRIQEEEINNTKKNGNGNGDMFTGLDRDGKPVDLKAALEVEDGAAAKAVKEDTEKNPPKIVAHVESIPDPSGGPNVQNRGGKLSRTVANGDMATGKNEKNFEIIPDTTKAVQAIDELGGQFSMSASDGVSSGIVAGSEAGKKRAEQILDNIKGIAHIKVNVDNPTLTVSGANGKSFTFTVTAHSQGKNLTTIPNYGSYAQGRIKGGKETALTGELGYEVAWFPSEGKSTILGLNGPEMVDLPKDAVVFPHKQSKKILKGNPNRPDLGSHEPKGSSSTTQTGSKQWAYSSSSDGSGSSSSAIDPKTKKKISKATNAIEKIEKSIPIAQRNIELKLSQIADRLNLNMDLIKRYLERPDASKKGLESESYYKQYRKDLENQEKQSLKLEERYQKQYNSLGKKGKKNANVETVSYGKKGKANVNLNKYIKYDPKTGTYILDKKALKGEKNKAKRNAIAEAAQKLIDDTTSKLNKQKQTTLDAIQKQEELKKLVDDTFYNWEMELKRIHEIQMQINTLQQRESRYQSAYELEKARAKAGYGDAETADAMAKAMRREGEALSQRIGLSIAAVNESKKNLDALFNISAIKSTQQQDIAKKALQYVPRRKRADGSYDYDINTGALEARYNNGQLTKEEYDKIKEYLDKIVNGIDDLESKMKDAYDAYKESFNKLTDIRQQLADYEQKVFEGLKAQLEEEINNQKSISASITNQLKKLYDEVKKALDLRRQLEDNAKTEADIQKKQQRLAMLRADTSGGNALEIAQLEKEIGDAQQNYQRSLEDQLLQKLQDQADKAAEQREEQIELQEAILNTEAELQKLMDTASQAVVNLDKVTILKALGVNGKEILGYYGKLLKGDEAQMSVDEIEALLKGEQVYKDYVDAFEASDTMTLLRKWLGDKGNIDATTDVPKKNNEVPQPTKTLTPAQQNRKNELNQLIKYKENEIANWQKELKIAKGLPKTKGNKDAVYDIENRIKILNSELSNLKKEYSSFATGGLNTTTGPAWLDGTKSKPELVLNATDTKNFLQLKDVLSHVMKGAAALPDTSAGESNTYEININVDHLNNDYDVDKVAERVKKIIVKDSSYRNVTAVRKFR